MTAILDSQTIELLRPGRDQTEPAFEPEAASPVNAPRNENGTKLRIHP